MKEDYEMKETKALVSQAWGGRKKHISNPICACLVWFYFKFMQRMR
jgi:hypothetical protein